jgi:hypothetical protein
MIEAKFSSSQGKSVGDSSLPARPFVRLAERDAGRGRGKRPDGAFRELPGRLGKRPAATIYRTVSSIKYHARARKGELWGFASRPLHSALKPDAMQTIERALSDPAHRMPGR